MTSAWVDDDLLQKFSASLSEGPHLGPRLRDHLVKVYATVTAASLLAAFGAYVHMWNMFIIGGGALSFLIGLASLLAIYAYPDTPENRRLRFGLLFNFAFMQGLTLGPLVEYSSQYGGLMLQACFVTAGIFVSFSLAAITCQDKRIWLFLGGLLGTSLTVLTWLALFNSFFDVMGWLFTWELYLGLLTMSGYIFYDTSLILHRVALGSEDVVMHAVELFTDLIGVFVRVLVIMLRNQEKKGNKSRRSEYAG